MNPEETEVETKKKKQACLIQKVGNFSSLTNFGKLALHAALALLEIYPAIEKTGKVEILETVRASLLHAQEVFNVELIKNRLIPTAILREVL